MPKIPVSKLLIVGANKTIRKVFLMPQTQNCQLLLFLSSLAILRFYLIEADKTMVSFFSPGVKLDRFDGTNFTPWKGKLFSLLIVLKIAYVLDPNLPPIHEPN